MMKTLLIDMDSVICDLMTEWHRRYNLDYNDDLAVHRLECWKSEKYVKPECGTKVYDYLDEPGLFLHLQPYANAIHVLERLHTKYEILVVTSSRTYAFTEKELWVERYLPFIGRKNLIFTHRKEMIRGDLLFDDAPHNLKGFQATGRVAVAMDYPYNRDVAVHRVTDWLEFEQWIYEYKWGEKA
jgi:5'-nucleotidase